jgi:hypothetical protein
MFLIETAFLFATICFSIATDPQNPRRFALFPVF